MPQDDENRFSRRGMMGAMSLGAAALAAPLAEANARAAAPLGKLQAEARRVLIKSVTIFDVLVPQPTYPLYTAVLAKLGARARFYHTDPDRGWAPDLDHVNSLVTPATRALVVIDPNNPTGASYSTAVRRGLLDLRTGTAW